MAKHVFWGAFIQWYIHKGGGEEEEGDKGLRVLPYWDPKIAPTYEQLALLSLKGLSIWVGDDRVGSLNATRLTRNDHLGPQLGFNFKLIDHLLFDFSGKIFWSQFLIHEFYDD